MKKALFVKSFGILALALGLSACGSTNSWVQSATVTQTTQNSDNYVNLSAVLNTGSSQFVAIGLPIMNASGKVFGMVTVVPGTTGTTGLTVSVDLQALGITPSGSYVTTLPNGYAFPVTGPTYMAYKLGTGGSEFYADVSSDLKTVNLGVALVIPSFSTQVPATAFVPFTITSDLTGMAGIFTSPAAGESGFGLFANIDLGAATSSIPRAPVVTHATPAGSHDFVVIHDMLERVKASHKAIIIK